MLPAQEALNEILRYDGATGLLFWRVRSETSFLHIADKGKRLETLNWWNKTYPGTEAFITIKDGYRRGKIFGKVFGAHRVIWKMITGDEPAIIDHINGDKVDNRFENLRSVASVDNQRNMKKYKNNQSGVSGVTFCRQDGVWRARIGIGAGEEKCLGSYSSLEEAVAARRVAEVELGYHPNHGR